MVEIASVLLEFIIVFFVVYGAYYVFNIKNLKTYNRNKAPMNIKYLIYRYNLDVVKVGYKKLFKTLMFCDSMIVAILFSATRFIDNVYIRLLVAFILVFPLFAGVYHLVAKYYEKEIN